MSARGRGRPAADDPTVLSNEALLDAALDAFAERGFEGTSIRELSRDLGVSHNLIPQRFGTKQRLWRAAIDHGFGRLVFALAIVGLTAGSADTVETALTAESAVSDTDAGSGELVDPLERLRAMVVAFVEANAERPALLRIINQEAAAPGPRLDYLYDSYIDPVREFGTTVLDGLKREGRVRSDSISLLYFLMVHGIGGMFSLPGLAERFGDPVGELTPEQRRRRAAAAVDVLFDGLVEQPRIIDN